MSGLVKNVPAWSDDVVCIVGMHRSGTSLIAQLLKQSGLYLGSEDSLLGGNVGNQDGHFENLGFIELHDAILKHFGGSWEFPPDLPYGWQNAASLDPLRSRARDLVRSLAAKPPWGWKDPRTSLMVPIWRSLIPNLRFVICLRSPLAVATSLQVRNKMPLTRGVYLWHRYLRASLADTEGCKRLLVFYDDYFKSPEREVTKLFDFCGLRPTGDVAALAATIRADLRHQPSDIAALLACDQIPSETKLLYLGLRGLELSGEDLLSQDANFDERLFKLLSLLDNAAQHQVHRRMPHPLEIISPASALLPVFADLRCRAGRRSSWRNCCS